MLGSLALATLLGAKTVSVSYSYAMGDNETKLEAKKIALEEAKQRAIEKIGVWIQSSSVIENGVMKEDKISSFVLGFAQTEVIEETFDYPIYTVTLNMSVDESDLKAHLPKSQTKVESHEVVEVVSPKDKPLTMSLGLAMGNSNKYSRKINFKKRTKNA